MQGVYCLLHSLAAINSEHDIGPESLKKDHFSSRIVLISPHFCILRLPSVQLMLASGLAQVRSTIRPRSDTVLLFFKLFSKGSSQLFAPWAPCVLKAEEVSHFQISAEWLKSKTTSVQSRKHVSRSSISSFFSLIVQLDGLRRSPFVLMTAKFAVAWKLQSQNKILIVFVSKIQSYATFPIVISKVWTQ